MNKKCIIYFFYAPMRKLGYAPTPLIKEIYKSGSYAKYLLNIIVLPAFISDSTCISCTHFKTVKTRGFRKKKILKI